MHRMAQAYKVLLYISMPIVYISSTIRSERTETENNLQIAQALHFDLCSLFDNFAVESVSVCTLLDSIAGEGGLNGAEEKVERQTCRAVAFGHAKHDSGHSHECGARKVLTTKPKKNGRWRYQKANRKR